MTTTLNVKTTELWLPIKDDRDEDFLDCLQDNNPAFEQLDPCERRSIKELAA